jgi:hypothetical protein
MKIQLLEKTRISFEQNIFASSLFLNKIIDLSLTFINAKDGQSFLFIDRVLIPLISEIFQLSGTTLPDHSRIINFIQNMCSSWQIEIKVPGECGNSALARTSRAGDIIHFNPSWILRADLSYQKEIEVDILSIQNCFESAIHEIVGCLKLMHEILHTFTPKILAFENAIRTEENPNSAQGEMKNTPIKLGTKPVGKGSVIGDMGYGLEEILMGRGLHLFLEYSNRAHHSIQKFTAKGLYFERRQQEEVVLGKRAANVAHPSMKYSFELLKFANEDILIDYLYEIRKAFKEHLADNTNSSNARSLYDCFKINLEQLVTKKPAETIQVSGRYFTRNVCAQMSRMMYEDESDESSEVSCETPYHDGPIDYLDPVDPNK